MQTWTMPTPAMFGFRLTNGRNDTGGNSTSARPNLVPPNRAPNPTADIPKVDTPSRHAIPSRAPSDTRHFA
jgi:hypothetical protein